MLKPLLIALLVPALAAPAAAMTLTADGFTAQGIPGPPAQHDRVGLVNDGSFEYGECDAGSAWTCTTNTTCTWILDPTAVWGYPAYDGVLCAWLGGFCGTPNSNSFCQTLYIDGTQLDWYWMGYVNSACGTVSVTINGTTIWSHTMLLSEHTYGTWNRAEDTLGYVNIAPYCLLTVNLCFNWVACPDGVSNDNMLVDYVLNQDACIFSPAASSSISTVKSRY